MFHRNDSRGLIFRVRARSQLGTWYIGKQLKSSFLARKELVPSMTKNTALGDNLIIQVQISLKLLDGALFQFILYHCIAII